MKENSHTTLSRKLNKTAGIFKTIFGIIVLSV